MKKGDDIRKTVVRQISQPDKQTLTIIEWQHFGKQNCNWLGVRKKTIRSTKHDFITLCLIIIGIAMFSIVSSMTGVKHKLYG